MAKQVKPEGRRVFIGDVLGLPYAPVVETGSLIPPAFVVHVLPQDVKGATCKDPMNCAIARGVARMEGFKDGVSASIGSRVAFIPMKVPYRGDVKTIIAKMQATGETMRAIKKFDRTGTMPEAGFRFIPVAQSHTAEAYRTANKLRKIEVANGAKKRKYVRRNKKSSFLRSMSGTTSAPRFTA